jgi:predicted dehydrogenase
MAYRRVIMSDPNSPKINRRRFLHGTGAGVALFNVLPGTLAGAAERLSANDKLNVAGIGIGSRGGADLEDVAKLGHNIVALCDVDEKYAAKEFAKYPNAKRFTDYRVMLDKMGKEFDGVVIGTPDHTHAVITMEAMRHGKHVYCEKPLAHSVYEVREVMSAARRYKVVTQLGNQGHSSDSIRQVCEWVWAGAIGKIHTIHAGCDSYKQVYCQIPNLGKLNEPHEVPKGLDYDLWLGPAEYRPYSPLWVPWNWRGWMPFGCGTIGDWICHVVDPGFWALELDAPETVVADVTGYDPVKHGLTYPPATKITFEFPARKERGPVKLVWFDGNNTIPKPASLGPDDKVPGVGGVIFGDKGMIIHGSHGAGQCYLAPESLMDQYSGKNAPAQKIPRIKGHAWDWAEAIRTSREAGSNFGYGGPLSQVALLGLIAIRFPGETLKWNDKAMRFTNNEAANAFLKPVFRNGWKLLARG